MLEPLSLAPLVPLLRRAPAPAATLPDTAPGRLGWNRMLRSIKYSPSECAGLSKQRFCVRLRDAQRGEAALQPLQPLYQVAGHGGSV